MLIRRKKGSLTDMFVVGIIVTFIAFTMLIGFKLMDYTNTTLQDMDVLPQEAKTASTDLNGVIPNTVDNTFLFFIIMLGIVILVLAAMVRVHPIFIPLFIIALIGLLMFAGVLSNIYQTAATNDELQPYADQMEVMTFVLTYLPLIFGVFGTLLMVVMYKGWAASQY